MSGFTAGVIVFPGSNCDRDAARAWQELGCGEAKLLWHRDTDLQGVDLVIVPGGFSYGDALRAGAVARFAPIMDEVARFAQDGGLVMGICNGFQILCEAGLLPGALARNQELKFVCKHVDLRVETADSAFTRAYERGETLSIPIAHGEGRYVCDEATHAQLVAEDRIVFRYASANPNGSQDGIAGVLGGPSRNVMGMMPHPERAVRSELGSTEGAGVFRSIVATLSESRV